MLIPTKIKALAVPSKTKIAARLNPLLSRTRLKFGEPNDFRLYSRRSWELAPNVTREAPSAVFYEADIGKLLGVSEGSTIEEELKRARGGTRVHGATVAHELTDAVLSNGHLFTRRTTLSISGKDVPLFAWGELPTYTHGVIASTMLGIKYFGHWMHDDLPLTLAASSIGPAVSVLTDPTPNQTEYLNILDLATYVIPNGYFKSLVLIEDAAQNDFKLERYLKLREAAAERASPGKHPGVMLLRGTQGQPRVLLNESEVIERMRARGWLVLDPALVSASDVVDACTEVPMVLGVEGSQLCNGLMWMSRGGGLVVIQSPHRFATILKNQCDSLGITYAFIVGDPNTDGAFCVDVNRLESMIDGLERKLT